MSENITYRHLKDDENKPYATLALIYSKNTQTAYFAGSLCSDADNFSYKRGREIANYRLIALIDPKAKDPKQLACIVEDVSFEKAKNILHDLFIQPLNIENLPTMYQLALPE